MVISITKIFHTGVFLVFQKDERGECILPDTSGVAFVIQESKTRVRELELTINSNYSIINKVGIRLFVVVFNNQ